MVNRIGGLCAQELRALVLKLSAVLSSGAWDEASLDDDIVAAVEEAKEIIDEAQCALRAIADDLANPPVKVDAQGAGALTVNVSIDLSKLLERQGA